jgi:hypothetical protein
MSAHGHWGPGYLVETAHWNQMSRKLMQGQILVVGEDAKILLPACHKRGREDAASGEYDTLEDADFVDRLAKSEIKLISCCSPSEDGEPLQENSARRLCRALLSAYKAGWSGKPIGSAMPSDGLVSGA